MWQQLNSHAGTKFEDYKNNSTEDIQIFSSHELKNCHLIIKAGVCFSTYNYTDYHRFNLNGVILR